MATTTPNTGHLPFNFMDKRNCVGNTENRPEIWDGIPDDSESHTRHDNVTPEYLKSKITPEYGGYFYLLIEGKKLMGRVLYPIRRTPEQHAQLMREGWAPNYDIS